MKTSLTIAFGAFVTVTMPAYAQVFSTDFTPNASIPDGLITGLTDTRIVSAPSAAIANLTVNLVIAGDSTAANGDFYATLTHGTGFSVLLNRVGRTGTEPDGYPDNGFNITFDDHAAHGDTWRSEKSTADSPLA